MESEQNALQTAAVRLILESRSAAVLSHINPDGDTLGSALALAAGLRQLGKEARVFCADALPGNLAFLPGYDAIAADTRLPDGTDLIVMVDASDLGRFGAVYADSPHVFAHARLLNVDHHATNHYFGDVNLVNPSAAATGEQVYELLGELGVEIDVPIATCLLTAIVTDTRSFRTPSTTPRTLATATRLYELGAPLPLIVESVYRSRSLSTLRLWGLALERLHLLDGIAWTEVTREMQDQAGASPTEGDGVVDLVASLRQIKAVVLFRETDDGIKVSMRATDGFDVAEVAAHFGGGGHPRAAGCLVPGRLAAVQREVLQYLAKGTATR